MQEIKKINKLLNIDKPLVIFDIDTTGLVISRDKIVRLAYTKLWPNGRAKSDLYVFDPEIKIEPEASSVHGIYDEDVRGKPKFRKKCQEVWEIFNDSYYGGHNILSFDLPIIRREFIRCGIDLEYSNSQIIDTRVIFQTMVPRSLGATYEFYLRKKYRQAHSTQSELDTVVEILASQLTKYKEVRDVEFIKTANENFGEEVYVDDSRKFYWKDGEAYFAFSKYQGMPLAGIAKHDPEFLHWIMEADFSEETKMVVKKALEGEFLKRRRYTDI